MFGIMKRRPEERNELSPWGRNDPFGWFETEMEHMLRRLGERFPNVRTMVEMPEWEVADGEKEIVLRVPVPGFAVEEIAVNLLGDRLTVIAEHKVDPKKEAKGEVAERRRVERTVTLPAEVKAEAIEATYRNGLLEIRLPRVEPAVARVVPVKP